MKNFAVGALCDWTPVEPGELVAFEVGAAGERRVSFDVMASGRVEVFAAVGEREVLVGVGEGLLSCSFSTTATAVVGFAGDASHVFVKTRAKHQVMAESQEPTFTTIAPVQRQNHPEVDRLFALVQMNERRREAALAAERETDAGRTRLLIEEALAAERQRVAAEAKAAKEKAGEQNKGLESEVLE